MARDKIKTSKGNEYEASWIGASAMTNNVLCALYDQRPIAQIVPEFDGVTDIVRTSEYGEEVFDNLGALEGVSRQNDGTVLVTLSRGQTDG